MPPNLQLWILDFLTNRKQYVKTSSGTSSVITINTGAPQGCVLSAFLFVIYTNAMKSINGKCKIIKYADDTVVIGLIDSDNDESEYRNTISYVADWCSNNFLDLNVTKTKEMIIDFRKTKNIKEPVVIGNKDVEIVDQHKYLGVTIQNNLKWNIHIDKQIKKANQRMYHVRCLVKLRVDNKLITLFYNSIVSSVLMYAITCWFNSCSEKDRKRINRFRKKVSKVVSPEYRCLLENAENVHISRCIGLVNRIVNDQSHPFHNMFRLLRSQERFNVIYCKTARSKNTFIPSAINICNNNFSQVKL